MEIWILVMWINGTGMATAEFNSYEACKYAREAFLNSYLERRAACFKK